jgi:hypothetical protein
MSFATIRNTRSHWCALPSKMAIPDLQNDLRAFYFARPTKHSVRFWTAGRRSGHSYAKLIEISYSVFKVENWFLTCRDDDSRCGRLLNLPEEALCWLTSDMHCASYASRPVLP